MTVNIKMLVAQIAGLFVYMGLVMFLAAGTFRWPAGWAYLILFCGFTIALSMWLLRHNPGLLTERLTGVGKADQKGWDKVFIVLLMAAFLAWFVLMALDAVRFEWSQMAGRLQVVGAMVLLGSFYLFFLTFRENSYLSPAVRIQSERGHTVVSTGPYHVVRHPMYAAALVYFVGTSLLLGSWYGLLSALILVGGIVFRAVREERTLREELAGYDEYATQVRYRLIPYVW